VIVQSNFGGVLAINGAPVGRELGRYAFQNDLDSKKSKKSAKAGAAAEATGDGSIMIVVATDAPLDSRNLDRLATRALTGLSRTGSSMSNGSGDYVIAFSTAVEARRRKGEKTHKVTELANDEMSLLFQAVAEATEEAIYNSMFRATTVKGFKGTVEALPIERMLEILKKYNALNWDKTLPPRGK